MEYLKYIGFFLVSVFLLSFSYILFSSNELKEDADSGRFVITHAGDRTFLLDTKTGQTWKYFFESADNQGWLSCFLHDVKYGEEVIMLTPNSDIYLNLKK